MITFDKIMSNIEEAVEALPVEKQAFFLASCADAMFPIYESFSKEHPEASDTAAYQDVVKAAFQDATLLNATPLLEKLEANTPHEDDFSTISSFNAICAAYCALAALSVKAGLEMEGDQASDSIEGILQPFVTNQCEIEYELCFLGEGDDLWRERLHRREPIRQALKDLAGFLSALKKADLDELRALKSQHLLRLIPPSIEKVEEKEKELWAQMQL